MGDASSYFHPPTIEAWKARAEAAEAALAEMREALRELVDLVDDQFVPDTFTLARARAALASQEEHRE